MDQSVKEKIIASLEQHCWKDEEGNFYLEIYADYRDDISGQELKKICNSECPEDAFYERFEDWYCEARYDLEQELFDKIASDLKADGLSGEALEEIRDEIYEMFYISLPYKHFLNQDVMVDIIVDADDLNSDYTDNSFGPHYNGYGTAIPEEAGLLWLVRQQGYKKSELKRFLDDPKRDSPFLYSVYVELANCSSHMNALTFLVKMTLQKYFDLRKAINAEKDKNQSYYSAQRKGRGHIVLDAKTTCGLYDPWNGSGSMLEIKLDKDVRLPIRLIDTAKPDGCRGYSIQEIYHATSEFWSDSAIKKVQPMKKTA